MRLILFYRLFCEKLNEFELFIEKIGGKDVRFAFAWLKKWEELVNVFVVNHRNVQKKKNLVCLQ